jgi:MarR family transcriptional regulator, 2-MHQ and catechol-resistance regulon repressor
MERVNDHESGNGGDLLPQEHAIMRRVASLPIDYRAMAVVANIWRTSQAVKLKLERELLRECDLTWAGFSTLFIVWVWEPIEIREIAQHQGVARATVTSNVTQLASNGFCRRTPSTADRRLVFVELTAQGRALIEDLFPRFNQGEAAIASSLSFDEQEQLAQLLRKVYAGMNGAPS